MPDRTGAERLKTIFKDKLDIGENTLLPHLSRDAIKRQITFDEFIKSLLKQNYLEKASRRDASTEAVLTSSLGQIERRQSRRRAV